MTATPSSFSSVAMPSTKPFVSATCASTLFAWMTSARWPCEASALARSQAEEREQRVDALLARRRHRARRRIDAEHRDAFGRVVLQQVAVVARELDHEASRSEVALENALRDVRGGVLQQRIR